MFIIDLPFVIKIWFRWLQVYEILSLVTNYLWYNSKSDNEYYLRSTIISEQKNYDFLTEITFYAVEAKKFKVMKK